MNRISVAEAASELAMTEENFLRKLQEMGISAEDSFSTFDRDDFERVKNLLDREKTRDIEDYTETRVRPNVIRRRRRPAPLPAPEPEAPSPEIDEPSVAEEALEAIESADAAEEVLVEAPEAEVPETVEAGEAAGEPDEEPIPIDLISAEQTAEEAAAQAQGVIELVSEEERKKAKKEKPEKKAKPKRVKVKGVTKEPAKVLEKPTIIPTEPLKPFPEEPSVSADTGKGMPVYRTKKPKKVIEILAGEPTPVPGKERAGRRRDMGMREVRFARRERMYSPPAKKSRAITRETKKTEITTPKAIKRIIRITDEIAVGELAKRMGVKGSEVIRVLIGMGMMVSINQSLDFDTASIVATEFGFELENVAVEAEDFLQASEDREEDLQPRPPVVTIMGHVDHGKTSLLEAIREADMLSREAGGITQHIGAYDVELEKGRVVFLDTPGHEAFTSMRARGAQVTDIVVLCVAADDGVMPQTKEAINHAKAAGVPVIVAINKIDKADANIEKVRQSLTEFNLVAEEWGGETLISEVSAKKRIGIEHLLEQILLQAEMMELKANPDKRVLGVIIESKLEKGRGPVVTVLIKEGTLRIGDPVVSGNHFGKVRTMTDYKGRRITEAEPSTPVEVVGLSGVPNAGDPFHGVEDEKVARQVAEIRADKEKAKDTTKLAKVSLEDLFQKIQAGETRELNIIIKADVQGSSEALSDALSNLSTDAVKVNVIHTSVGGITETDVNLASASNAMIIGFNVRPEASATPLAEREGVQIKNYSVIYDVIDEVKAAMVGLLEPAYVEKELGRAEVRQSFTISKVGTIAGCLVQDGKALRNARARLVRDGVVVYTGKISSLRRFKDDAKEVAAGMECGIGLENYNDIKENDIIEIYELEEVAPEL